MTLSSSRPPRQCGRGGLYYWRKRMPYLVKKTQRNDSRMTAIYQRVDAIREAGTWSKSE